jgi:predicted DNA-binding protein (MmcQ/YjbR family)
MNILELHDYCVVKNGAVEEFPFGEEVHVFKVANKMFALLSNRDNCVSISLKCEPDISEILRMEYPAITPGYHLNKRHWNTVKIDGTAPEEQVMKLVDRSYQLVVKGLTKQQREKFVVRKLK